MPTRIANSDQRIGRILLPILSALLLITNPQRGIAAQPNSEITVPFVSAEVSPIDELRITDDSYAAVRKPPGDGLFPAVIFLHGGLGHASMESLREDAMTGSTHARFLAWGYVTVNATRRDISHDPQDRGVVEDTLAIVREVKRMPHVDPDSVMLYGGSGGGTLALEVAGKAKLAAVAAGEPATIIYMGMFTKEHRAEGRLIAADRLQEFINADLESLYTPKVREHTRRKLSGIQCPVLILHGDQHWLRRFNLDAFVPEMKSLGKSVEVTIYPGENHGFYWGRSKNPAMPLKANQDARGFFREHIKTQPKPIDASYIKPFAVQPRHVPGSRSGD